MFKQKLFTYLYTYNILNNCWRSKILYLKYVEYITGLKTTQTKNVAYIFSGFENPSENPRGIELIPKFFLHTYILKIAFVGCQEFQET